MEILYGNSEKISCILENLDHKKYIITKDIIYIFFIKENNLILEIYDTSEQILLKTHIVEKNVKMDYGIYIDSLNKIHMVVINKKYDLLYIKIEGMLWKKEIVYNYSNNIGIPHEPLIKTGNNLVFIAVSFLKVSQRGWSLQFFTKNKNIWECKVIDEERGLCYNQQCFEIDIKNNIYLVYRYKGTNNQPNLKVSYFDNSLKKWIKPNIIVDNGINKYKPNVFIQEPSSICVSWIEFKDGKIFCCTTNNWSYDYTKIEVTENGHNIGYFNNSEHLWIISIPENKYLYDLCCTKNTSTNFSLIIPKPKDGEFKMDSRVRLFLDSKKELEFEINQINKQLSDIEKEKQKMEQEVQEKNDRITQLANNILELLEENIELRVKLKLLVEGLDNQPIISESKEKSSLLKKIYGLIGKEV